MTAPEFKVKAAYIYKFIMFVTWPGEGQEAASPPSSRQVSETASPVASPRSGENPLRIAVLGTSPFKNYFNEIDGTYLHAKSRHLAVTYLGPYRKDCDLERYEILYVSSSEQNNLTEILQNIDSAPVLTVSDINGFVEAGGIIEFHTVSGRIRFAVNLRRANAAGLTISSKMLRAAVRVLSGPPSPTSKQQEHRMYTAFKAAHPHNRSGSPYDH
jgi:hypothetical protein